MSQIETSSAVGGVVIRIADPGRLRGAIYDLELQVVDGLAVPQASKQSMSWVRW